ncbi:MAG: peptidylprolyl isomerase [Thiohalomonadaceae bacterium]
MQISTNKVVSIDYTLTDNQGNIIDSSKGGEPLAYIHGIGNIIPGLENALVGKKVGDKLQVSVPPAEGYGERNDDMVQTVPREMFEDSAEIQVGMQFQTTTESGQPMTVTVVEATADSITVDANHPLAGQTLNFDVAIADVRDATEEELDHGHAHGVGGHQH